MYVDGKMRPLETIPGIGGVGMKENNGGVCVCVCVCVNSTMIHCKNFGKCQNVPQYNNNKKFC
jgi:hypothetical protein